MNFNENFETKFFKLSKLYIYLFVCLSTYVFTQPVIHPYIYNAFKSLVLCHVWSPKLLIHWYIRCQFVLSCLNVRRLGYVKVFSFYLPLLVCYVDGGYVNNTTPLSSVILRDKINNFSSYGFRNYPFATGMYSSILQFLEASSRQWAMGLLHVRYACLVRIV